MTEAIIFIICILIVFAFINLKDISPVVKLFLYFSTSILLKQGFIILEVNLEYLKRDSALRRYIMLSVYSIGFNPVMISFVLLKSWKAKIKRNNKLLILIGLVLFLTTCDGLLELLGFIHFTKWNLFFSAIRYTITISLLLFLLSWFDKKVLKI